MKYLFLLAVCLTLTGCYESFDERCLREAKEHTEKFCPQQVEAGVILDSTTYDMGTRTFNYWYSLHDQLDTPEAHMTMKEVRGQFRTELLRSLINSVKLRKCKEEGINFVYTYHSSLSKELVLQEKFTKDDYKR